MLKLITAIIFCTTFTFNCPAQHTGNDSLQALLASTSQPLQRFDLIRKELEDNLTSSRNIDSSVCIQLLDIAQHLKSDSLLAISYNWIGSYFSFNKGDNIAALEYYFKGIPLAEKANDKRRISSLYFDITLVYSQLKNYAAAFDNNIKGGENLPEKSSPMYDYMLVQYQRNLSEYYLAVHNADSALYYAKLTEVTANRLGARTFVFSSVFLTGAAYAMAKKTAMADSIFKKAIAILPLVKLNPLRSQFYSKYIQFLLNTSRLADAKIFCWKLLDLGNTYNSNPIRLQAVGYMQQVFDSLHQTDSAYYYSRQESKISADIFSEGNINRIQALSFHEKLRSIEEEAKQAAYRNQVKQYTLVVVLLFFILIGLLLYRNNRQRRKANTVLKTTLSDLKSTQSQLIQSEKMASLGELTTGIAHEIQNPLNFVNNFSEVNKELMAEMNEEIEKGNYDEVKLIAKDITANEEKINHHGKRADAIVKGMLQHSQSSTGQKEPTDINKLVDEYLRLSYHGLRAKDNTFNATLKTDFDESIGNINIIPQDIGRVILNLITNAFYAVDEKKKILGESYEPLVSVSTSLNPLLGGRGALISVKDNGNGIPQKVLDKIFQPFFTTKPTGQGTGLGLSLSYDIIKAHGGEIRVESKEGEGSTFTIRLLLNKN